MHVQAQSQMKPRHVRDEASIVGRRGPDNQQSRRGCAEDNLALKDKFELLVSGPTLIEQLAIIRLIHSTNPFITDHFNPLLNKRSVYGF